MSEDPLYAEGDEVQLKSGGPTMVVERVFLSSSKSFYIVTCSWFDGNVLNKSNFNERTLKSAPQPSSSV